ncbi:uncharacterized protein METZ01_LOCUS496680 [marine metagenome]|uniref:Uncharacterized protein n=1 Tax=marine metagenome TaxID=408172 RepID=A0A383DH52_9ZZZZ
MNLIFRSTVITGPRTEEAGKTLFCARQSSPGLKPISHPPPRLVDAPSGWPITIFQDAFNLS